MKLRLQERIREAQDKSAEYARELNDYQMIFMLIRSLQAVETDRTKFTYDQADYDKVVDQLHNLCAKHEILIPESGSWTDIEIV